MTGLTATLPLVDVSVSGAKLTTKEDGLSKTKLANVGVFVFVQAFPQLNGHRVTFATINGLEGAGVQAPSVTVRINGGPWIDEPKLWMPPKQPYFRRGWIGPDRERIKAWEFAPEHPKVKSWHRALCKEGLQNAMAYAKQVGPYRMAHGQPYAPLRDYAAVSGIGVGPMSGGPKGWPGQCREGLIWHEFSWLAWANRARLMRLNAELEPLVLKSPYFPGRNALNEAPGWNTLLKDGEEKVPPLAPVWAGDLMTLIPQDISHLMRMVYHAWTCAAAGDIAAQWLVTAIWADVASWLDGDFSPYSLLQPAAQIVAQSPKGVGDHRGGRASANAYGAFLAAEQWLSPGEKTRPYSGGLWRDALTALIKHWSIDANGITHAAPADAWPAGGNEQAQIHAGGLKDPICRVFEQDLVSCWAREFGLVDEHAHWKTFAAKENGQSIQEFVEARAGMQRWPMVRTTGGYGAQYPELRDDFSGYQGGLRGLIGRAADESPDENPLDRVPWSMVAAAL